MSKGQSADEIANVNFFNDDIVLGIKIGDL